MATVGSQMNVSHMAGKRGNASGHGKRVAQVKVTEDVSPAASECQRHGESSRARWRGKRTMLDEVRRCVQAQAQGGRRSVQKAAEEEVGSRRPFAGPLAPQRASASRDAKRPGFHVTCLPGGGSFTAARAAIDLAAISNTARRFQAPG